MLRALVFLSGLSLLTACVTETVEREPGMRFTQAAVVSVQDPSTQIRSGSAFAWHPDSIKFYEDERLKEANIKQYIEKQIISSLKDKGMQVVESEKAAGYTIAYTAALESALDDNAIIRRYGLLPGNVQIPADDQSIEKGSLIIYVFDGRSWRVVWRSAAQAGVGFDMSDEDRRQRIVNVISAMFQSFPVRQAK